MVNHVANLEGVYRTSAKDRLFSRGVRVLKKALIALPHDTSKPSDYGVVFKGLPLPASGGSYLVECLDAKTIRIVAYFDLYGRAFSTSEPLTIPPACIPNLYFARDDTKRFERGKGGGLVYVQSENESYREVAQFSCARNGFSLFDSWYNFGEFFKSLSYHDAMARAYLAFVYRPSHGAPEVPSRGLSCVFERLRDEKPLAALRLIASDVYGTRVDPCLVPPALVCCLARWLSEAGLDALLKEHTNDDALRLVRTVRYAKVYYMTTEDDSLEVSLRTLWSIEAALNRFLLVSEMLGEEAALVGEQDCIYWDGQLFETVAAQHPTLRDLADAPLGNEGGEWDVRCALSSAVERLRLPVRIDVTIRADALLGEVSLDVITPDADFMPRLFLKDFSPQEAPSGSAVSSEVEGGSSSDKNNDQKDSLIATPEMRQNQALRYALHLGLILSALAFETSPTIDRVNVVLRPFYDEKENESLQKGGEFPHDGENNAWAEVVFKRDSFNIDEYFEKGFQLDPIVRYKKHAAVFNQPAPDALCLSNHFDVATTRNKLPEELTVALPPVAKEALGAQDSTDLRIHYDGLHRSIAEDLADRLAGANSVADATSKVRAVQDKALASGCDRVVRSCTHLMEALVEGSVERSDQNSVVSSFLGEDRCLAALGRAQKLAARDTDQAVDILIDAVSEARALDGFIDSDTTVFRAFDSYMARVLYNRARASGEGFPSQACRDHGKRVELTPDSFYLCHLEIVRLLEHSFERADEALRYGKRAIELAPATAAGYRQLGRAYMLVGDMDNASLFLQEGLHVAVAPSDIAMAYYQLAYVLWKLNRAQDGAACYLKSLSISPMVAIQASAELHELIAEADVTMPSRDKVDLFLVGAGIPVAPSSEVLEVAGQGAALSADSNMFSVARNLLSVRLRYRPDDALVGVIRSLGL